MEGKGTKSWKLYLHTLTNLAVGLSKREASDLSRFSFSAEHKAKSWHDLEHQIDGAWHKPGESLNTLCENFLLSACAMMDAGSLGSASRPPLFFGRRGVPPGDLAAWTVLSLMLPMSRSISPMPGCAGVARLSDELGWEGAPPLGPGVGCMEGGPPGAEGVDETALEPRRA